MRAEAMHSKNNIIQAFTALLRYKPYDKISIKEIRENAHIFRQTFYAHYSNKDDIFKNFYIEMINDLKSSLYSIDGTS